MVNVNFDLTKFLSPNLWRKDEPSSIADLKYDNKFGFENVERPERSKYSLRYYDETRI